jgi:hypothetical protein
LIHILVHYLAPVIAASKGWLVAIWWLESPFPKASRPAWRYAGRHGEGQCVVPDNWISVRPREK